MSEIFAHTHTGYFPGTHLGHPSCFEWYYGPVAENFGGDLPNGLEGRDHVINCVTHSDMRELVCGSVACSVLIQLADGMFLDDESDELLEPAESLEKTRSWAAHI
jgi:hypothetical protein